MDSTSNFEGLALRFAPYVDDLHAFFSTSGVPFGNPADLVPFATRLTAPGRFQDDMASITRSIIYRENTEISMVELLGLLVVAVGGPQADHGHDDLREPVGQMVGFTRATFRSLLCRPSDDPRLSEIGTGANDETSSATDVAAQPAPERAKITESAAETSDTRIPTRLRDTSTEHRPAQFSNIYARAQARSAEMERLGELSAEPAPAPALEIESLDEIASFRVFIAPEPEAPDAPLEPRVETQLEEPRRVVTRAKWPVATPAPASAVRQYRFPRRALALPVLAASVLAMAGTLALHHRFSIHTTASVPPRAEPSALPRVPALHVAAPAAPVPSPVTEPESPDPGATSDPVSVDGTSPSVATAPAKNVHLDGKVPAAPASQLAEPMTHTALEPPSWAGDSAARDREAHAPGADADHGPADSASNRPERLARLDRPSRPDRVPSSRLSSPKPEGPNRVLVFSSGIMSGNLLAATSPEYPKLAGLAHVEGQVILQAVVGRNGTVTATHVLRGSPLLRGAAEHAVRRWRFRPYLVEGHPTEVATVVTLDFRLHR